MQTADEKPGETHRRMVESAMRLQQRNGIAGTAFSDVLADSGASRGAIYHHFPGGRAELAALATDRGAAVIAAELADLVAGGDPTAALERFVGRTARGAVDDDYLTGCVLTAGALDLAEPSPARRAAAAGFKRWETILVGALLPRLGAEEAERIAVLTIAAIGGALILVRAERDLRPLERVTEELRALLSDHGANPE